MAKRSSRQKPQAEKPKTYPETRSLQEEQQLENQMSKPDPQEGSLLSQADEKLSLHSTAWTGEKPTEEGVYLYRNPGRPWPRGINRVRILLHKEEDQKPELVAFYPVAYHWPPKRVAHFPDAIRWMRIPMDEGYTEEELTQDLVGDIKE